MWGRARLSSDVSEIKITFGIPPERPTPNIAPSWNLAPTDPAHSFARLLCCPAQASGAGKGALGPLS
jgi:hypothetical protein